jgi:hypothetical protein
MGVRDSHVKRAERILLKNCSVQKFSYASAFDGLDLLGSRERMDLNSARQKLAPQVGLERCFVEVRRRTRPMVCFVNVQSVDRIIYSIFQRFNLEWKNGILKIFTQAA